MLATAPSQPQVIVAPAPARAKKVTITSGVRPVIATSEVEASSVPDAAVRAALVTQAGAIRASERTSEATKKAAETSAHYAFIAACLALVGALFGGLVAWRNGWLATRTTQQIKHADYRQAWIDKLREEMARFTRLAAENDGSVASEAKLKESISIIVLRMDKDDPDYGELTRLMGEVSNQTIASKKPNAKTAGEVQATSTDAITNFLLVSQRILKREWEVTKRDMHATPWGRPLIWIANWQRRRRREEEKEVVRRSRLTLPLDPPKQLWTPAGWSLWWQTRQKPPRDPKAPILRIGRLELRKRELAIAPSVAEI